MELCADVAHAADLCSGVKAYVKQYVKSCSYRASEDLNLIKLVLHKIVIIDAPSGKSCQERSSAIEGKPAEKYRN